jgi:hypothetical protein
MFWATNLPMFGGFGAAEGFGVEVFGEGLAASDTIKFFYTSHFVGGGTDVL